MGNNYNNRNNNNQDQSLVLTPLGPESKPMRLANVLGMTPEYVQLVRDVTAPKSTEEEFCLFLQVVNDTGLNPLTKEIWFYKMWDGIAGREMPVIHASIQGMRKAAEKIGGYCPGKMTEYTYSPDGSLVSAIAHVKRKIDGDWQEISFEANWDEFVKTDRNGKVTGKWLTMPKHMLGKCAEFNALKRAFPTLEALANSENLPTESFNAAFNDPTPAPTGGEVIDPEIERLRKGFIDNLLLIAEIMLDEEKQGKLSTWVETAGLDDLKTKHANALLQFTQYARGVFNAIPEEERGKALEEFNAAALEDLDFETTLRFVYTYQKPIEEQEHPAGVEPPAPPAETAGGSRPRPRQGSRQTPPANKE